MKWVDSSKGILDYMLAAIPLASLVFIVGAYFHTIHPRFEKYQELQTTKQENKNLRSSITSAKARIEILTENNKVLKRQLSNAENRLSYAERRFFAIASPREIKASPGQLGKLLFGRESVLAAYTEYTQRIVAESGDTVDPATIRLMEVQVNKDEVPDLYLTDAWSCGSGGCMGPLFVSHYGAYCFVAWMHSTDLASLEGNSELQCRTFRTEQRPFLYAPDDKNR